MKRKSVWLVALTAVTLSLMAASVQAQKARMDAYYRGLDERLGSLMKEGWKYQILMEDSKDGDGLDVELRMTMPINEFMEFAPIAALEAASIPHKFAVVYIFLREEKTDRVGHVAFVDAEPIAGRYLAGDKYAVKEMQKAIIWH